MVGYYDGISELAELVAFAGRHFEKEQVCSDNYYTVIMRIARGRIYKSGSLLVMMYHVEDTIIDHKYGRRLVQEYARTIEVYSSGHKVFRSNILQSGNVVNCSVQEGDWMTQLFSEREKIYKKVQNNENR